MRHGPHPRAPHGGPLRRRPTRERGPAARPVDLLRARYGAPDGTAFSAEHQALLHRLGDPDPDLHVDLPYEECFEALAAGHVDVVPDFAGIAPRFRQVLGDDRHAFLRYRDCGVHGYGTGLVATRSFLERHPERLAAFLDVVRGAFREMRADPSGTADAGARASAEIDPAYAVDEWCREEEAAVFGSRGGDVLGVGDARGWSETIAWRREVAGWDAELAPEDVYVDPGDGGAEGRRPFARR